jgi:hypothetical protein
VILLDVNVLVVGHRAEMPGHDAVRERIEALFAAPIPVALPDAVLVAFVRLVTNARIFREPTSPASALDAARSIREADNGVWIAPGPRHWPLFEELCRAGQARGDLVADAHLAALAIEHGCELVTFDRDFARFPGLRTSSPLD